MTFPLITDSFRDQAGLRALALQSYDQNLLATARNYDLTQRPERNRSVRELAGLFFRLVQLIEPAVFIEAGAMGAEASRRIRRQLPDTRIVAFEASPFTYRQIIAEHDFDADRIEYLNLALSDRSGPVTFNVNTDADGSPLVDGQSSLLRSEVTPNSSIEVTVDSVALDELFASSVKTCALWIDVEGAGQPVLTGASATLDAAQVVLIEVEDRAYWGSEAWLAPDVARHFFDHGLVPIARDFQSRYQYNVVYVRESLLTLDRLRHLLVMYYSSAAGKRAAPEPATPPAPEPVPADGPGDRLGRSLRRRHQ